MAQGKLLIAGASGQGKVVLDIFQLRRAFQNYAFLDDDADLKKAKILGIPVIGTLEDLKAWRRKGYSAFFAAVGNNALREEWCRRAEKTGFSLPSAVHPNATVSRSSSLGSGTVVMAGAVINPDSRVGRGCIINTCSSIDHDNRIGDFSQIMPGARLTGTVTVGRRVYIGTGAIVLPNLTLADDVFIGAGAVVTKSIHSRVPHIGIPARPMNKRKS